MGIESLYKKIYEIVEQKIPAALVTVIQTKGSTPREIGSKMIVYEDGSNFGTIGGSMVEVKIIEEAKRCLQSGEPIQVSHNLNDLEQEDTGMVCGGVMEFFIEPLNLQSHVYIFGGGHVALPLANFAQHVGFTYSIIEDREQFASSERFPEAKEIIIEQPGIAAANIKYKPSDFVVIVTRSHEHDYLIAKSILDKSVRYMGLIGSKSKIKQIFTKLRQDGFSNAQLNTIHTPIGLEINAQTPEEIAISIVAELIKIKNQKI
jgi:xanthine dehydrogenase accessory factor